VVAVAAVEIARAAEVGDVARGIDVVREKMAIAAEVVGICVLQMTNKNFVQNVKSKIFLKTDDMI
jgi:hypothetical protein